MLDWLFRRNRPRRAATALYRRIVAQSRLPVFYAVLGVPDTVEGRFELLALHMFLALECCRRNGAAVAQPLVDAFFADMDTTMRELGVGDLSVPKRMRRLAAAFYQRLEAYRRAAGADEQELADLIGCHILSERDSDSARYLAMYAARTLALDDNRGWSEHADRFAFAPIEGASPS